MDTLHWAGFSLFSFLLPMIQHSSSFHLFVFSSREIMVSSGIFFMSCLSSYSLQNFLFSLQEEIPSPSMASMDGGEKTGKKGPR
ncbi:hypothetical protein HOY82DRAFT_567455 [Tuber indicum]|nr:hypothetical protein HOY82DRAFT_567455 [Tuber indicum]